MSAELYVVPGFCSVHHERWRRARRSLDAQAWTRELREVDLDWWTAETSRHACGLPGSEGLPALSQLAATWGVAKSSAGEIVAAWRRQLPDGHPLHLKATSKPDGDRTPAGRQPDGDRTPAGRQPDAAPAANVDNTQRAGRQPDASRTPAGRGPDASRTEAGHLDVQPTPVSAGARALTPRAFHQEQVQAQVQPPQTRGGAPDGWTGGDAEAAEGALEDELDLGNGRKVPNNLAAFLGRLDMPGWLRHTGILTTRELLAADPAELRKTTGTANTRTSKLVEQVRAQRKRFGVPDLDIGMLRARDSPSDGGDPFLASLSRTQATHHDTIDGEFEECR